MEKIQVKNFLPIEARLNQLLQGVKNTDSSVSLAKEELSKVVSFYRGRSFSAVIDDKGITYNKIVMEDGSIVKPHVSSLNGALQRMRLQPTYVVTVKKDIGNVVSNFYSKVKEDTSDKPVFSVVDANLSNALFGKEESSVNDQVKEEEPIQDVIRVLPRELSFMRDYCLQVNEKEETLIQTNKGEKAIIKGTFDNLDPSKAHDIGSLQNEVVKAKTKTLVPATKAGYVNVIVLTSLGVIMLSVLSIMAGLLLMGK